jgi:hypothetical protein
MKPPQDPPRLLDQGSDAPAWYRAPLEAGARDVASPERLARIAARLPSGPIVHVSSPGPGPSDAHGPATQPTALPAAPPAGAAVPSVLSGAVVGAALGLAVVGVGWVASPRAVDSWLPAPPARTAPSATVTPAPPEPLRLEPAKTPAPRPRTSSERPEPVPSGTASPAASVDLEPAGSPAAGPEPEPPAREPESAILQRAQDALRDNPALALALTDLHVARFPGGVFAQEREVIAVSALLGMGRAAEARARATRFLASFPTSAHRRRLEVLIPDLESSAAAHKDSSDRPSTP